MIHVQKGVQHACQIEKREMADENEDQWLYGDSTDGKEYSNIQSEIEQNDSTKTQEKSQIQEDCKVEGTNEMSSDVRA